MIARSYGGAVALDLALRYPDRVRALAQLEGDGGLSLSEAAMRELTEFEEQVVAAADIDMDSVPEMVVRGVLGDAGWGDYPSPHGRSSPPTERRWSPSCAVATPTLRRPRLRSVEHPTLLVGAKDSLLDYTEVMALVAEAMPSARVEWVEGGHLINPAHPVVLAFVDEVLALRLQASLPSQ